MSAPTGPKACVIGDPVAHSLSPVIHRFWLSQHGIAGSYDKVRVSADNLEAFVGNLIKAGYAGANVTIPHKELVARLCDRLDPTALAVGSVNTLWFDNTALIGANSDVAGFLGNLDDRAPGWDHATQTALVLGAGGAARAVIYGLNARGIARIIISNRHRDRAESLRSVLAPNADVLDWTDRNQAVGEADLIVNTTALGMTGQPPLDLDLTTVRATSCLTDIVYRPLITPILHDAAARGLKTVDGLGMLLHQAVLGFSHWFGITPEVTPDLRQAVLAALQKD